jgi:predicted phosphodiesterase
MKIGLISDLHGNLPALERVLEKFELERIDRIICCGDIIGYGPFPNECAALVRDRGMITVRGNHDTLIGGETDLDMFSMNARRAGLWTRDHLSPEIRDFLLGLSLPAQIENIEITHASFRDPLWEYILDKRIAYYNFHTFESKLGVFGHSHIPSVFQWNRGDVQRERITDSTELVLESGERYLINPGSVGQPRDGDWRTSCAIITLSTDLTKISFLRLEYDVEETRREMYRVGLPPPLYDRLLVGA